MPLTLRNKVTPHKGQLEDDRLCGLIGVSNGQCMRVVSGVRRQKPRCV
jgi:hypothetical protein